MVSQRFNRLLSRPDPSLRPYGSVTFQVDKDRKGELPPSLIDKYLLKRAAGFKSVCFQSHSAVDEGLESWNRRFFRIKLPQIAAVLAKYHAQLEVEVFEGGGHMFFFLIRNSLRMMTYSIVSSSQ
ncbi:hypothetical protein COCOBI_06-0190 [Coccomyxa sp. Obi]|nr:hypothetical protein COCOBI_06-0190 [Coccomyxa sp. Obi]